MKRQSIVNDFWMDREWISFYGVCGYVVNSVIFSLSCVLISYSCFFLLYLQSFPDKDELLRNMMGLLGNVAEVKRLRNRLMTTEFITVFSDLLGSCRDGIEVSVILVALHTPAYG